MKDLVKLLGAPGSIPFLIISILVGVLLLAFTRRFRRVGAVLLIVISSAYVVLAFPVVGVAIANALPRVGTERPDRIATLIVLDGDNRRGRVREVQRVLDSEHPQTVWILGGRWILDALKDAAVSGPSFKYDSMAPTTLAQIDQVQAIAKQSLGPTAVIVSRLQAPRVVALVRSHDIPVAVLPSAVDDEPPTAGMWRFVPSYIALRVSRDAIYEHVALAYYTQRRFVTR